MAISDPLNVNPAPANIPDLSTAQRLARERVELESLEEKERQQRDFGGNPAYKLRMKGIMQGVPSKPPVPPEPTSAPSPSLETDGPVESPKPETPEGNEAEARDRPSLNARLNRSPLTGW